MRYRSELLFAAVAVACTLAPVAAAGSERIGLADDDSQRIWSKVEAIGAELEALRFYMGKPFNKQPALDVNGADAREVYYQLVATFRNAERLCFQHLREHTIARRPEGAEVTAADSLRMADAVLSLLRKVRRHLGVEAPSGAGLPESERTPSDLFCAVVQANRQLNLLLDQQVAPSDVFEQVTRAVGYTARLLEVFPDAVTIPAEPEYVVGRRPGDVYRRLLGCREIVREISAGAGQPLLELHVEEADIEQAAPSDVYHLASLVLSEVSYLHSQHGGLPEPPAVYYVGRKFPSDVYQRVGLLERQLTELRAHAGLQPDWLITGAR